MYVIRSPWVFPGYSALPCRRSYGKWNVYVCISIPVGNGNIRECKGMEVGREQSSQIHALSSLFLSLSNLLRKGIYSWLRVRKKEKCYKITFAFSLLNSYNHCTIGFPIYTSTYIHIRVSVSLYYILCVRTYMHGNSVSHTICFVFTLYTRQTIKE